LGKVGGKVGGTGVQKKKMSGLLLVEAPRVSGAWGGLGSRKRPPEDGGVIAVCERN